MKEGMFYYSSVTDKSYEDPMPNYISPELVMLIAQNAPSELDVFKRSLKNGGNVLATAWFHDLAGQELNNETKICEKAPSKVECGVQVILPSKENSGTKKITARTRCSYPEILPSKESSGTKKTKTGTRCSCPDAMTQTLDADGGRFQRMNNVKRKRPAPTTLEPCKLSFRNTRHLVSETSDSSQIKLKNQHGIHLSSKSVGLISGTERKAKERPLSAPVLSPLTYQIDALNVKPWRHGMRKKHTSAEPKSAEKVPCERKAEFDEKKKSELKKYMAMKFALLRKGRQLQKVRAAAAEVARKEKQRKLDAECQALLKSQSADVKDKERTISRLPWISEYVTLAENFRPWSSASTSDLPPPKVPQSQAHVPLDLYTSVTCQANIQDSALSSKQSLTKFGAKRRSKKLRTREAEKQPKESNRTLDTNEMAFSPAHPYHDLHPSSGVRTGKKSSSLTKARWKSKGSSLKTFKACKIYQHQFPVKYARREAVDLMAYKKSAYALSRMPPNGSFCRETRSTRSQKQSKSNGYSNILRQDDRYAISVLKEHERNLFAESKVKRPKVTSVPTAEHTSQQKLKDSKPVKYSRVEPDNQSYADGGFKGFSLHDMAEVIDSRFSHHSTTVKNHKGGSSISPSNNYRIYSEKSSKRASLSPRKFVRNESTLQVLKSEKQDLPSQEKYFKDRGSEKIAAPREKDTVCADAEISNDVTLAVRRERMHMLRSLAEQLLKRLDVACAEQLQNTPTKTPDSHADASYDLFNQQVQNVTNAESEPASELHPDTANNLISEPVVLNCLDEPLQIEPKFCYHSRKPSLLYQGHLSEKEQAGCETVRLPGKDGFSDRIHRGKWLPIGKNPSSIDIRELNVIPANEISSHSNVTDKDSDIIPSGCSSSISGSSSPSTDSSQHVTLPTGVKYKVRKVKRGQELEEEARKRPKEAWTLPIEEDTHSVINLYTKHWLSRENKRRVRSEVKGVGELEGEREENISSASKLLTPCHEHSPEKHKFKFGATPICNESEMSELCIRSSDLNCTRPRKSVESSGARRKLPHYHTETVVYIKEERSSDINTSDTSSHLEKTVATTALWPMTDDKDRKHPAGVSIQDQPEGMLAQLDDQQLHQSKTFCNLRLDSRREEDQVKSSLSDPHLAAPTQMDATAAGAHSMLTESSEEGCQPQTLRVSLDPINITYVRRHESRITPDRTSIDDERIGVKFTPIHEEDGEPAVQDCRIGNESSKSSTSEVFTKHVIDFKDLDIPDYNSKGQKENHGLKDITQAPSQPHILQSKGNVLSSDRSIEVNRMDGASDEENIHRKDSTGTPLRGVNSQTGSELQDRCDFEETEGQGTPQNGRKDVTTTFNENRLSTCSGSKNRSNNKESSLHSTRTPNKLEGEECNPVFLIFGCIFSEAFPTINANLDSLQPLVAKSNMVKEKLSRRKLDSTSFLHYLAEEQLEFFPSSKCEVQAELHVNNDFTREWELKSKRSQLEAELQKLDAEIKRTRAKLQANQYASDAKIGTWDRSVETETVVPACTETADNSTTTGGVPSLRSINGRLPQSPPSAITPADSPKLQRTPGVSSKVADSSPVCTADKKEGSPVYSNSFVSEDIQIEHNPSASGSSTSLRTSSVVIFPHPEENLSEDHEGNGPACPDISSINENLEQSERKREPPLFHDHSTVEVARDELITHRTASWGDNEGSENSTGRVPDKKWSRSSRERQGELISSASDSIKAEGSSAQLEKYQAVYSPFPMLEIGSLRNKRNMSTIAPEPNAVSEAIEDLPCKTTEIKAFSLSSVLQEAGSVVKNDGGTENSCRHWRDASIYPSHKYWNISEETKVTATSASLTELNLTSTTSLPIRNQFEAETLEEVSVSNSVNEAEPKFISQISLDFEEVVKVLERPNPSSRVEMEQQNITEEMRDSVSSTDSGGEKNEFQDSCGDVNRPTDHEPDVPQQASKVSDISGVSSVFCQDSMVGTACLLETNLNTMSTPSSGGLEDNLQYSQEISPNVTKKCEINITNNHHPQDHTSVVLKEPQTRIQTVDTDKGMLSNGIKSESEQSISSDDLDERETVTPNHACSTDLKDNVDTTANMNDTVRLEYSDSYSSRMKSSEASVGLKTAAFSIPSSDILTTNEDRHKMANEVVQDLARMVMNSQTGGGTAEDVLVPRSYPASYEDPISPRPTRGFDVSSPHGIILDSDNDDNDFCSTPTLGSERPSWWKEVSDFDMREAEGHDEEHTLTSPVSNAQFTNRINELLTSLPPKKGHRLINCSGLQVLNAISGSLVPSSCKTYDKKMVKPSLMVPEDGESPSSSCSSSKSPSSLRATVTVEVTRSDQVFPHEGGEGESPACLRPSRPNENFTLGINNQHGKHPTEDNKPFVFDMKDSTDLTQQNVSSRFQAHSDKENGSRLQSINGDSGDDSESYRENDQKCCQERDILTDAVLSAEVPKFMDSTSSSVPQLDSNLPICLNVPRAEESKIALANQCSHSSTYQDDKCSLFGDGSTNMMSFEDRSVEHLQPTIVELDEGCATQSNLSYVFGENNSRMAELNATREGESPNDKEGNLSELPSQDTQVARCYDQDSNCSTGSGKSQDLDGTLEEIQLQTLVTKAGKHTMMADTLTDELLESLMREVLYVGWRTASFKHKFLWRESFRPYLSNLASWQHLPVQVEGQDGPLHHTRLLNENFEQRNEKQPATSEAIVPIISSKAYVQSFVQKTLELSNLLADPSPSEWYDVKTPVGQDTYEEVMETQHRSGYEPLKLHNRQGQNTLLPDLVNESLVEYSAMMHQLSIPSSMSSAVDGGNVLQFVTNRILQQATSASKHGPDVDKLVGKLVEDEHWEKCYEEIRDLISELAQGILFNLIDSFVQEMIQGKNHVSCRKFSPSVDRNVVLVS
ncbi:hypothetical protein R1flu_012611 [Riccia fluitans]|uniref:Uncharacterized protein n=1 Tax=Riccia fluitans TaxID=41844 RepID=A0ABD1ZC79_9MARC